MSTKRKGFSKSAALSFIVLLNLFLPSNSSWSDVLINVLAVNGSDKPIEKEIRFSLPGEIHPENILDTAGLAVDYDIADAGYYLYGKVSLQPKESRTMKVKVQDIWQISQEQVDRIKGEIENGFKEMGAEKNIENGQLIRQSLLNKLNYIVADQEQASGSIDNRIDLYRNHLQTLNEIKDQARSIDHWRSDARDPAPEKLVYYKVSVENPSDRVRNLKQKHYLPEEVKPQYIQDRKGYEIRYDDKKGQPFLFREEDIAPKERKLVSFAIRDMWYIPANEESYIRTRSQFIDEILAKSKYSQTSHGITREITNLLDLIAMLQNMEQPDIQQHIGAYRINQGRFARAKVLLDDLEKLLSRHRSDLEKSKIKNVMQKMQSMKSLARVSQAIFDKKPTVNAAWRLIGIIMIFLAVFMIIYTVFLFVRSSRDKKQELLKAEENSSAV